MADAKILDVIAGHAAQAQTGTIMAVFSDNSIGRFYLVGGIPTTARYRNRQGQAALDLALEGVVVSSNFHVEADLVRSGELLSSSAVPAPAAAPAPAAMTNTAPRLAPGTASTVIPDGEALTGPMRLTLESVLSEHIGPVAPLIVADLPQQVSISDAILQLSREIEDPNQTAEFVREARSALG